MTSPPAPPGGPDTGRGLVSLGPVLRGCRSSSLHHGLLLAALFTVVYGPGPAADSWPGLGHSASYAAAIGFSLLPGPVRPGARNWGHTAVSLLLGKTRPPDRHLPDGAASPRVDGSPRAAPRDETAGGPRPGPFVLGAHHACFSWGRLRQTNRPQHGSTGAVIALLFLEQHRPEPSSTCCPDCRWTVARLFCVPSLLAAGTSARGQHPGRMPGSGALSPSSSLALGLLYRDGPAWGAVSAGAVRSLVSPRTLWIGCGAGHSAVAETASTACRILRLALVAFGPVWFVADDLSRGPRPSPQASGRPGPGGLVTVDSGRSAGRHRRRDPRSRPCRPPQQAWTPVAAGGPPPSEPGLVLAVDLAGAGSALGRPSGTTPAPGRYLRRPPRRGPRPVCHSTAADSGPPCAQRPRSPRSAGDAGRGRERPLPGRGPFRVRRGGCSSATPRGRLHTGHPGARQAVSTPHRGRHRAPTPLVGADEGQAWSARTLGNALPRACGPLLVDFPCSRSMPRPAPQWIYPKDSGARSWPWATCTPARTVVEGRGPDPARR